MKQTLPRYSFFVFSLLIFTIWADFSKSENLISRQRKNLQMFTVFSAGNTHNHQLIPFNEDFQSSINEIIEGIQKGKNFSLSDIPDLSEEANQELIRRFTTLLSESNDPALRLRIYRYVYLSGIKFPRYANQVVYFLVDRGLSDSNIGNRKSVCTFLNGYNARFFTPPAKNMIASYAIDGDAPFEEITCLTARLGLTDLVPHYRHLLISNKLTPEKEWTIKIALGRLGDAEAADWCIDQVRRMGMNDLVVNELVPDLVFMSYKPAIDFLLQIIMEDEKNCSSPNPDSNVKINCAYRLIEFVAPVIVDFPVSVDEEGELLTNDYNEALEQVRLWIEDISFDYSLKNID
jgi:hypothetical protein